MLSTHCKRRGWWYHVPHSSVKWILWDNIHWHFNRKSSILVQKAFQNVAYKMFVILSRHQCVRYAPSTPAKCSRAYWKCSVKIILNNVPQICFCNIFQVMCCTRLIFYSTILCFNVLIWHLYFILMLACGATFILYSMQVRLYYYNADTSNLLPHCDGY